MDMTLYALLLNKLNGQTECTTWNGFKIEVVDEIPTSQVPNTIYFVKSTIVYSKEGIVDENGNNIVDENGNNIVDENGNYIVGSDS